MAIDEATPARWVSDARRCTVALHADLTGAELAVPYLRIINPPVWELGHVAWFQEHWILDRRDVWAGFRTCAID